MSQRLAVGLTVGVVVALTTMVGSASASAATSVAGDRGVIGIHTYGTPSGSQDTQPKRSGFNVEGVGFAPGQLVAFSFAVQAGDGPAGTLPDPNWFGPYTVDSTGHFASDYFNQGGTTLANGHYDVTVYGKGAGGAWVVLDKATSGVFQVYCPPEKTGTLTVVKQLKEGSDPADGRTFPVVVTCPAANYEHTFTLAVGASATTDPLPSGTACTVSETPPTGWDPPTYVPSATVTLVAGETVSVLVMNNLPPVAPAPVAGLTLVKAHQPTGAVKPGDVIAYRLTATARGNITQDDVVVSDVIPLHTTYVAGSAACVPATHQPCHVTYDAATRTLTVGLGKMAPHDVLAVTFSVTVDTNVPATAVITNFGTVGSNRAKATSNRVTNWIVEVLGETVTKPPAVIGPPLAATGPSTPAGTYAALGLGLVVAGLTLLAVSRRWGSAAQPSYAENSNVSPPTV